jgi:quercetin dioxygenase-like cupin family protein
MPKSWTNPNGRPQPSLSRLALLLLALSCSLNPAAAETVPSVPPAAHVYPGMRTVLSSGNTVTGQPIRYPSGAPARLTAVEITLQPGEQTGWHTHPVPVFGYILEGELTIDYGARGQRTFVKGEALAEAMDEAHDGRNTGRNPATILAVFIGMEDVQASIPAPPPARR